MRYEIVVERNNAIGYGLNYVGPWAAMGEVTKYADFKDALEFIGEWGLNKLGKPRKTDKIGIYDHKDNSFYTQAFCLTLVNRL